MSKHTPGPWFANRAIGTNNSDCGWHIEPECIDYQYRGTVCSLNDSEHIGGVTKIERDANARLIAAAPTMHDYIAKRAAGGDEEAARILEAINGSR